VTPIGQFHRWTTPGVAPQPWVPLAFLAAASWGLVGCGAALVWARTAGASDPTADPVVAAAHFGVLATLSMGVVGAMHQYIPVIAQRPLRSMRLARVTFVAWLAASWLLALGVATRHEAAVETGGALAAVAVTVFVVNVSAPLSTRGKGAPIMGLRFAVAGFVVTAFFGVVYVFDRTGNWFDLSGRVVLAHASIGLFAFLGLTYVAVAEKLWPMFLLARVPDRRMGWVAVCTVPGGVALFCPGLLFDLTWLAWSGAVVVAIGLGAHLASLYAHVRHRRRPADLHLVFLVTAAFWLVAGVALALAAQLTMGGNHHVGVALVAASVAAFGGWLLEALVGHAHKIVPLIAWSALRSRGIDKDHAGRTFMAGDLYDRRWATFTYGLTTAGIVALCVGLAASLSAGIAVGGVLLVLTGIVMAGNLSALPTRMLSTPGGQRVGADPVVAGPTPR